jgi:hypothetical protein
MEHLVYIPAHTQGPKAVLQAHILDEGSIPSADEVEAVEPVTPWLGFAHDEKNLGPFHMYGPSSGWRLEKVWDGELRHSHDSLSTLPSDQVAERVAALLQSWLYFGLLEAFVDKKVKISFMTKRRPSTSTVLYSKNLCHALQGRVFQLRSNDDKAKKKLNDQIQNDISLTHDWIRRFTAWSVEAFHSRLEASYPGFMKLVGVITPAIVRLAEALECTCIHALPNLQTLGARDWYYPYFVGASRRKIFLDLGWCPFTIKLLEETTSQSLLDWIVSRKRRYPIAGHALCDSNECVRNKIDEWSYVQQHATPDCECPKLKPNVATIPAVLVKSLIPLITVQRLETEVTIEVSDAPLESPSSYVAISHVWVDGLGGSTETGLHRCQTLRLQTLVSQLMSISPAPFWIDTLCIPEQIEYRNAAILQMRNVYQNATAVLVLDKSIQTCKTTASTEEILLSIYSSPWMQRMWTYQEAVLGKRLVFVLEDGLWEYKINTFPSMRPSVAVVWRCLAANIYRLRTDRDSINIGHVYSALRWRSTSRREDELLVVSTLLRAGSKDLFDVNGKERMKRLWLRLKLVPYDIPLLDGPKLAVPGFRWAPSTFMHRSKIKLDTENAGLKSACTTRGLMGDYMTVVLARPLHGNRGGDGVKGKGTNSIFHVYVHQEDEDAPRTRDDKAHCVLRLYCNENWPKDPDTNPFDMLLLGGNKRPESGQWLPAAALVRQRPQTTRPGVEIGLDATVVCDYVGRLLVERLQINEVANKHGTVMSAGSEQTFINAAGVWVYQRLCIR